jgi:hypothetical protein
LEILEDFHHNWLPVWKFWKTFITNGFQFENFGRLSSQTASSLKILEDFHHKRLPVWKFWKTFITNGFQFENFGRRLSRMAASLEIMEDIYYEWFPVWKFWQTFFSNGGRIDLRSSACAAPCGRPSARGTGIRPDRRTIPPGFYQVKLVVER